MHFKNKMLVLFCFLQRNTISVLCPKLLKLLKDPSFGDVLVPYQIFMNPSIPPNGRGHKTYDAFPQ